MSDISDGTYGNGRYQLLRPLGAGGMGQVFLARDTWLDRLVALKVLRPEVVADREHGRRLAQEARVMGKLHHDGIVTIFDVFPEADELCLVLEYVEGTNLRRYLNSGAFTRDFGIHLLRSLAQALSYLHDEHGVVHRDLKPENILIGKDGRIKVADFGIARRSTDEHLTATGYVIGTKSYMAPEVVDGQPATSASDIWALGLVMRESFAVLGQAATPSLDPVAATINDMLSTNPGNRPTAAALLSRNFSIRTPSPPAAPPAHAPVAATRPDVRDKPIAKTAIITHRQGVLGRHNISAPVQFWSRDERGPGQWKRLQIPETELPRHSRRSSSSRYNYLAFGTKGERMYAVNPEGTPTFHSVSYRPFIEGIRALSERYILPWYGAVNTYVYEWSGAEGAPGRRLKKVRRMKIPDQIERSIERAGFISTSCWVIARSQIWLLGQSPILGNLRSAVPLEGLTYPHHASGSGEHLLVKTNPGVFAIRRGMAPRHANLHGDGWYAVKVPVRGRPEKVMVHDGYALISTYDGAVWGADLDKDPEGGNVERVAELSSVGLFIPGGYITVDGQTHMVSPRRPADLRTSSGLPPGRLLRAVSNELLIMQE
ncbi:serine/threonine-protein kinase [Paenarthrobacter sp. YJN-5]|uniref:serine/threonine-protein kinase n=1 Tax=Paenarthrobacter sp. YJN-5 TaxID=2735316 RepID=UPI0018781AAD|nr:serine/threonine-protein kinase [Paenarthrobacter sp. YJN-5]QOT19670.1 serine/threonine protein kinase [Paenarthrobacter sp. YJN-5]